MDRQSERVPGATRRIAIWWRMLSVVVVALTFGVLMQATLLWAAPSASPVAANEAQSVPDHEGEGNGGKGKHDDVIVRSGIVMTRPEENTGVWVIGEKSFTVTEDTEVEGSPEAGDCVEVKVLESDPNIAIKIIEKDLFRCFDDDDLITRSGMVMTRPDEGVVGLWVIGEKHFSVTENTKLEGDLAEGSCAKVTVAKSDPSTALKIEEKDRSRCDNDDDHDDHDDDDHDDDGRHGDKHKSIVRYGRVEARPEGKVGTWVIGGSHYSATERTELDHDHGRLMVGTCAKVKVHESEPTVAREIESEKEYKCRERDGDGNAKGTLYGVIQELPPTLNDGIWVIGGISFTVSPTGTELISKGINFAVDMTVKVKFTTDENDNNLARRIELVFGHNNPCRHDDHDAVASHGRDDDHRHRYGHCPGSEGKAIGIVQSMPQDGSLLGDWMIGGIPYVTNASTRFFPNDEFFPGVRVKVEYVVVSPTLRLVTSMKQLGGSGGLDNPDHSLIVGFVDEKPETGFVGNWVIEGEPFVAISETVFLERGAFLAVGAYVVVEYKITDNERVIFKIIAYPPPGAGDETQVGKLESMGSGAVVSGVDVAVAVDADLQNSEVWRIGGVDYIVSEATQIVSSDGELAVGDLVSVNSFTENGQRYATMVRAQESTLHLPFAVR